jgi:hypothetical protein
MNVVEVTQVVKTAEGIVGLVSNALAQYQTMIERLTPQEVLSAMREKDIVIRITSHVGEIELRQTIIGLSSRNYVGWLIGQVRDLMINNIVGRGSSQIQRSLFKLGTCKWTLTIGLEKPAVVEAVVVPAEDVSAVTVAAAPVKAGK